MRGPPIAPDRVMLPLPAIRFRSKAPLTVLDRVRFPPPELKLTPFVSVIAELMDSVPLVVISEPKETPPAPVWVKLVLEVIGDIEATVSVPLFVMLIAPLVEVRELFTFIAAPVKLMLFACTDPLKVEVPVAETIVKGPLITTLALTSTVAAL